MWTTLLSTHNNVISILYVERRQLLGIVVIKIIYVEFGSPIVSRHFEYIINNSN